MLPLDDFIGQYSRAADALWLAGLASAGYTRLDWPGEFGGPGLSREQKLITISRLIDAGCPLFPQAITVLAPLITNLIGLSDPSARDEARAMLDEIATMPAAWRHVIVDDTLFVEGPGVIRQLGDTGQAPLLLASNAAPLFCLYEIKLTLSQIRSLQIDPDEATGQAITDLAVTLAALEGQYLTGQPRDDLQIALAVHRERLNGYSLLFQSLGYYALLDPDDNLAGNEPVPYVRERAHLKRLRQSQDRDTVLQQDLVYEALLESMTP